MIPAAFDFQRAGSVEEALALKQEHDGDARFIAGGHSLVPLIKLRLAEPTLLIDISRIPGLSGVSEDGGRVTIGALTTHAEIESNEVLMASAPVVAEAAGEIGDQQVRNRGTIGGSLAHSDPASDLPAVVVALDATIHITGSGGERSAAAGDFFQGLFEVDLGEDEMITAVSFDAPSHAAVREAPPPRLALRDRGRGGFAQCRRRRLHGRSCRRHRRLDARAAPRWRRGRLDRLVARRRRHRGGGRSRQRRRRERGPRGFGGVPAGDDAGLHGPRHHRGRAPLALPAPRSGDPGPRRATTPPTASRPLRRSTMEWPRP